MPEGGVKPAKEDLENETTPSDEVRNDAQVEEKMETNEETAEVAEESIKTQENVEHSNAEVAKPTVDSSINAEVAKPTVDSQVTEQVEETVEETTATKDEVERASNEQELKYWNAVNENPQDFTSWTYLLQFVEQEVSKYI